MYWHSCPHGHEAHETKIGWFCKTCVKVYPSKRISHLVPQTNKASTRRLAGGRSKRTSSAASRR